MVQPGLKPRLPSFFSIFFAVQYADSFFMGILGI